MATSILAVLFVPSASAGTVVYGHTLGGPLSEDGLRIGVDGSGNVYQFGRTGTYPWLGLLAKWDPQGALLWQRVIDTGDSLSPGAMAVLPDGTVYFAAQSGGNFTGATLIGKVLADGTLAFSKVTPAMAAPLSIAFDPASGGAIVSGLLSFSPLSGGILAVDGNGDLRWSASSNATTIPVSTAVDGDGTSFVAAARVQTGGRWDAAIVAFDATGAFLAEKRLTSLQDDEYGWSVTLGPDGDLYYLGLTLPSYDTIFARFTTDLTPAWTEFVGSPSFNEYASRIVSRGDGTFLALVEAYDYSSSRGGGIIYRVDSSGALVESEFHPSTGPGGPGSSSLHITDLAVGPDGTVLVGGTSYRSPPRNATPVVDARVNRLNASWVSDPSGWHPLSPTLTDLTVTLRDPNFPADDFRVQAGNQAWYGAIDVTASPVNATVHATITDRDNRTVAFSANVSGGTPPYTYRWSFGDANGSTEANPTHGYGTSGRYPVQLMVEDNASNRAYATVDVLLGGPPVVTSIDIVPNPTHVGEFTSFYAVGDDADGTIVNWHWDFGDGMTLDSSYPSAYHYYYVQGTFNVTVTAQDDDGLEASASELLQVLDWPPQACMSVSPNPTFVGYPTNFADCSYDRDGYIVSAEWDFGDGTTDSGRYLTHAYSAVGDYIVRLTVTDNAGNVATLNQSVSVRENQLPVARFSYSPSDPTAGEYVYFYGGLSFDPDGYIAYWTWDFGDGTNLTNWYSEASHWYPRGGWYNVTLTVTDNFNGEGRTGVSLYVDISPTATFTVSRDFGKVGTPLTFDASASRDPDGRIVRYEWNFGDGGNSTASGPIVSHVFAATGTYLVTLVVWDDRNATSFFQQMISVVTAKAPFAVLAYSPSRPFAGDPVSFDGSRSADPDGAIVRHVWQLGDGTVAEGATVAHRYAYPGTYAIHLTVVDEDGFAVTTSSEITIVSQPVAAFSVSPATPRAGEDVTFTANGSWDLIGSLVYHWDFGDGTHGAGWQTTKRYDAPGTYRVTLNVTNPFGVSSIMVQEITVGEPLGQVRASDGLSGGPVMASLLVLVSGGMLAVGAYVIRWVRSARSRSGPP